MAGDKKFDQKKAIILGVNGLILVVILACGSVTPTAVPAQQNENYVKTEIALGIQATSLQSTIDSMNQAPAKSPVPTTQPPPAAAPIPASPQPPAQAPVQPSPLPTDTPTLVPPTATNQPTVTPTQPVVLDVLYSRTEFYCYQDPYDVKITVKVGNIDQGMAVYYRIEDKENGTITDWEHVDLHRATSDTRTATLIGGGSANQNIHFPPHMHESWLVLQIITDDGSFRSKHYSDVTFFPCGN